YEPSLDSIYSYMEYEKDKGYNYSFLFFDYIHKFNEDGHEIVWSGFFRNSNSHENFTDKGFLPNNVQSSSIIDEENSRELYKRLKFDYTLPLSENIIIEAGYKIRSSREDESYGFEYFDYMNNNTPLVYDNSSDYSQINQAVYSTFASQWKGIKYKAGLRGEHTLWEMKNEKDPGNPTKIKQFDWFPSIHISYRFKGGHSLSGSYSKRIHRPASNYLEPFESYSNYYTKRIGNPALEPEYIDSYELNYRKRYKRSSFSFETYLKKTRNKIETYKKYLDEKRIIYSVHNVGHDLTFGAETAFMIDLFDWWDFTTYSQAYYYRVETDNNNEFRETRKINLYLKNSFTILKKTHLQFDAIYNGGSITSQREIKPSYLVSGSLRRSFFDKNLSLTFKMKDIFKTVKLEVLSTGPSFSSETHLTRYAPYYTLSLTYRIKKLKKRKEHDEENERVVNDFKNVIYGYPLRLKVFAI
ncbi:MAG: outer membrane beta-barrel family protein, partial [Bacteroidota bacterium]|nr:outer membrane beta-barrel family protein [Bacteroidota bacterium]